MRKNLLKFYYFLKVHKQQWYGVSQLNDLQGKLLRYTISNAYQNVPFYNKVFKDRLLRPEEIITKDDLKKIPVISKELVRDAFIDKTIINRKYIKNLIFCKTSGSSGFPLTVAHDIESYAYCEAIYARTRLEQGATLSDRTAYFWYKHLRKRDFWEHLGLFRKNEILYTEDEQAQFEQLKKLNPSVIHAFPSILISLSNRYPDIGSSLKPKVIITHGELLTEEARIKIEKAFSAKILDQYCSHEFAMMVWQCKEYGNYHVNADSIILEFLDEDNNEVGEGERGRIIVTSLMNKAMPLIRYDIGDYGIKTLSSCPCGRGLPTISAIEGRRDDFIVRGNNVLISPRKIGGIMELAESVGQYSFLQIEMNRFELKVVPLAEFSATDEKHIRELLYSVLGGNINLNIEITNNISRGRTGKAKAINSELRNSVK